MITFEIPGTGTLKLTKLVLDFNGTLALDGTILDGVIEGIKRLADDLEIHVITSDTFGTVQRQCAALPVKIKVLETDEHIREKAEYIRELGTGQVVAIGNGANDRLMLLEAALGIVVIGAEGSAAKSVQAADVIVTNILDAFGLLLNARRLIATLRI